MNPSTEIITMMTSDFASRLQNAAQKIGENGALTTLGMSPAGAGHTGGAVSSQG